jgi:hypothetical protein
MRLVAIAALAAAFLALSAVGFACGGGGGCDRSPENCHPESQLVWVNPTSATPSASWVTCSVSRSSSLLTVTVSELSPGSFCSILGTLENTGHESVHLYEQVQVTEPRGCRLFIYADNLLGLVHAPTLNAGGKFAYSAEISLSAAAGNGCQGASATFHVTISTSGGTVCEGFPYGLEFGPQPNWGRCQ